jgi:hypothetical protein
MLEFCSSLYRLPEALMTLGSVFMILIIISVVGLTLVYYLDSEQRRRNAIVLAEAVQKLDANPNDRLIGLQFLSAVTGRPLDTNNRLVAFQRSLSVLQSNLGDDEVQKAFAKYMVSIEWAGIDRTAAYRSVLNMLVINAQPSVKQFVLDIARWHYAVGKPNGVLTAYDEQAIQNDILAHSQSRLA